MTVNELKQKHPIIVDILEEEHHYTLILIFGDIEKYFDGAEEGRLTAIDEYCTRIESIIKSL